MPTATTPQPQQQQGSNGYALPAHLVPPPQLQHQHQQAHTHSHLFQQPHPQHFHHLIHAHAAMAARAAEQQMGPGSGGSMQPPLPSSNLPAGGGGQYPAYAPRASSTTSADPTANQAGALPPQMSLLHQHQMHHQRAHQMAQSQQMQAPGAAGPLPYPPHMMASMYGPHHHVLPTATNFHHHHHQYGTAPGSMLIGPYGQPAWYPPPPPLSMPQHQGWGAPPPPPPMMAPPPAIPQQQQQQQQQPQPQQGQPMSAMATSTSSAPGGSAPPGTAYTTITYVHHVGQQQQPPPQLGRGPSLPGGTATGQHPGANHTSSGDGSGNGSSSHTRGGQNNNADTNSGNGSGSGNGNGSGGSGNNGSGGSDPQSGGQNSSQKQQPTHSSGQGASTGAMPTVGDSSRTKSGGLAGGASEYVAHGGAPGAGVTGAAGAGAEGGVAASAHPSSQHSDTVYADLKGSKPGPDALDFRRLIGAGDSEGTLALLRHRYPATLAHIEVLAFAEAHSDQVDRQRRSWSGRSIPIPEGIFVRYYVWQRHRHNPGRRDLCMKHNGRSKTGEPYERCHYGERCKFLHECGFCRSREHGWFAVGRCPQRLQLQDELSALGLIMLHETTSSSSGTPAMDDGSSGDGSGNGGDSATYFREFNARLRAQHAAAAAGAAAPVDTAESRAADRTAARAMRGPPFQKDAEDAAVAVPVQLRRDATRHTHKSRGHNPVAMASARNNGASVGGADPDGHGDATDAADAAAAAAVARHQHQQEREQHQQRQQQEQQQRQMPSDSSSSGGMLAARWYTAGLSQQDEETLHRAARLLFPTQPPQRQHRNPLSTSSATNGAPAVVAATAAVHPAPMTVSVGGGSTTDATPAAPRSSSSGTLTSSAQTPASITAPRDDPSAPSAPAYAC